MGIVRQQKGFIMTQLQAKRLMGQTIKVMYADDPDIGIRYITITCMDDDCEGVYYKLDGYNTTRLYKPLQDIVVLD